MSLDIRDVKRAGPVGRQGWRVSPPPARPRSREDWLRAGPRGLAGPAPGFQPGSSSRGLATLTRSALGLELHNLMRLAIAAKGTEVQTCYDSCPPRWLTRDVDVHLGLRLLGQCSPADIISQLGSHTIIELPFHGTLGVVTSNLTLHTHH